MSLFANTLAYASIDPAGIIQSAQYGNSAAQRTLAGMYLKGNGVEKSVSKAIEWYEKSANAGDFFAQTKLGNIYESGELVQKNLDVAVSWYKRACESNAKSCSDFHRLEKQHLEHRAVAGDIKAQIELGNYYLSHDRDQALYWYQQASVQGNSKATISIADFLMSEGQFQEAMRLYKEASIAGDSEAMMKLGLIYLSGNVVEKNPREAYYWINQSVEKGHVQSREVLAQLLFDGIGVSIDKVKAVQLYRDAANSGSRNAQVRLGLFYLQGEGVSQSYDQAIYWLQQAYENGDLNAAYVLGGLYYQGKGMDQSYAKAFNYFEPAAKNGNAESQAMLGIMYLDGKGVRQNRHKAKEWFGLACDNGVQKGCDGFRKLNTIGFPISIPLGL